jgi:hypothetical protein
MIGVHPVCLARPRRFGASAEGRVWSLEYAVGDAKAASAAAALRVDRLAAALHDSERLAADLEADLDRSKQVTRRRRRAGSGAQVGVANDRCCLCVCDACGGGPCHKSTGFGP